MNTITFPSLNISLNINKIAFTILGISIYWYGIIIVMAIVVGLLLLKKRNGLYNIKFEQILDLFIFLIPISLISARIYYVVFNLEYYLLNPMEIINPRNGGIAIYGAIIGGIITCAIYCKKKNIIFLDLLDYIAPSLVLGQAIGRWGNFVNIEAYGIPTNILFRMGIMRAGTYVEVHPTFFYESLACVIIFIVLLIISNKRKFKGQIVCTYLLLYSLERSFVEGIRVDSLMLGKIRISQALSIIIFLFCLITLTVKIHNLKNVIKEPKIVVKTDKYKKTK